MRTNAKILIIDDEQTSQMIVSEYFTQHGCEVVMAEDGQAGIDKLKEERFDLIFLDLNMPRMSGTQALPHILDIDPHARVIIMTAFASYESKIETREQGAYDYMVKPLTPAKLKEVAEKALPERRHYDETPPSIQKGRIDHNTLDRETVRVIPERMARAFFLIPIAKDGNTLSVAMADPFDMVAIDTLKSHTGFEIQPVQVDRREILKALADVYTDQSAPDQAAPELEVMPDAVEQVKEKIDANQVRKLVNTILSRAIQSRATSVHIEPGAKNVAIRMRIDGALHILQSLPRQVHNEIVTRIATITRMDAYDSTLPNDGRGTIRFKDNLIDLRTTTLPTMYGDSIVIRIMDKQTQLPDIMQLGFDNDNLKMLLDSIQRPYGMVLLTGPVDSGKSTTLYAALQYVNGRERKIISIEAPVEFQIDGINQVQVNPESGLTGLQALQIALRQDPDVIMISELHDRATAEIAIEAALSGHMVFSTLLTHDAPSSITRLADLGVDPFLIGNSLNIVVAQRLVRQVCPECKTETDPPQHLVDRIAAMTKQPVSGSFFKGAGCESCNHTGYMGRTAIYECLPNTEEIRSLIVEDAPAARIREAIAAMGCRSLMESGLTKAAQGDTTLEEVVRVVH